MIDYEKLWFKLKEHVIDAEIPDMLKIMSIMELEEREEKPDPPAAVPIYGCPGPPPPSTTFVPVPQVVPKYGISAPIVTMYAVRPVDFDPLTGAPVGWQQSVSSTIKITEDKR